jgi:hypothetical protein
MSAEMYLTNYLGWLQEATYGADPNQDTVQGYRIGKYVRGAFPSMKREIQVNHNNNYYPSELVPTKDILAGNLAFEVVNCLPLKHLFTKADGTGISDDGGANLTDGIRTIHPVNDPITPNEQRASWSWRVDTGNSSENLREHYLGNMLADYTETMNFFSSDDRLQGAFNYVGKKRATPATDVSKPPIYPQSTSDSYKRDTNTILKWDGDSLLGEILNFSWTATNAQASSPVDASPKQLHVEQVTTGNQSYGLAFNVRRAGLNGRALQIDYRDQLDNFGSYNNMQFKIYNTASLYKDYTFSTCHINNIVPNIIFESEILAHPTWLVSMMPTTMSMTFKDGLNKTTFYNI